MKRPNFFIVGAPKCGTTSMADWLSSHPEVFLSTPKEPTFFCTDLLPDRSRDLRAYERLFADATDAHAVVGEASTGYLFSRRAVPAIIEYATDPRFLVMVRNPVDMAHALHGEQLYQGNEGVEDFATAWSLQDVRAIGPGDDARIPAGCKDPQLLQYGAFCKVGEQLERLLSAVPRDSVHVVVLDDVRSDPRVHYGRVLGWLDLADDDRTEFPVRNAAKARRSPAFARALRSVSALRAHWGPAYRGLGVLNRVSEWNRVPRSRQPLSDSMRATMADYFREDVERLGRLLSRDLSRWVDA